MKVTMIDPPSGWKYGFPKILPEGVKSISKWLVENAYPQIEIDKIGDQFYYRTWETELDD